MDPETTRASADLSKATTGVSLTAICERDRPLQKVMGKIAKVVEAISRETRVDKTAAAVMVELAERMHPGFIQSKIAVLDQFELHRSEHPVEPYRRNMGK